MTMIKVGDLNFEYYVEGSGPPLLMIMGMGGQASSWGEPFLEKLRPHFKIIRFSNRGTGLSDKPADALSIRVMADDAAGLLTVLGIEKAHVLGISMGGMIAQELVLNYPERVQRLVLGCTNCGPAHSVAASAELLTKFGQIMSMPQEERIKQFWLVTVTQEFVDRAQAFLDDIIESGAKSPTPMETFGRQFGAAQSFDTFERLPQITAQTLVIHGDRDILVPAGNADVLQQQIVGSQKRILADVGHCFFWEKPEESAAAVVEFLVRVPVAT
jgi:pimeloyl-ACP methyl ester carboxylesterase